MQGIYLSYGLICKEVHSAPVCQVCSISWWLQQLIQSRLLYTLRLGSAVHLKPIINPMLRMTPFDINQLNIFWLTSITMISQFGPWCVDCVILLPRSKLSSCICLTWLVEAVSLWSLRHYVLHSHRYIVTNHLHSQQVIFQAQNIIYGINNPILPHVQSITRPLGSTDELLLWFTQN